MDVKIISRYFTMDKFEKLIDNKGIFFSQASKQSDETEGKYQSGILCGAIAHLLNGSEEDVSKAKTSAKKYMDKERDRTFLSCWCIGDQECEYMWRRYVGNVGVMVVTDITSLMSRLASAPLLDKHSGKVVYDDYLKETSELSNREPYLLKKREFEKENEYRFVYKEMYANLLLNEGRTEPTVEHILPEQDIKDVKDSIERQDMGYILKYNSLKFIHKIVLSPGMSDNDAARVKELLGDVEAKITHSQLT